MSPLDDIRRKKEILQDMQMRAARKQRPEAEKKCPTTAAILPGLILGLLCVYIIAAGLTFAVRHPNAGQGVYFLHFWEVHTFQTVEEYR